MAGLCESNRIVSHNLIHKIIILKPIDHKSCLYHVYVVNEILILCIYSCSSVQSLCVSVYFLYKYIRFLRHCED